MTGSFVLTSGRSGSTFLARRLTAHPDVVVVSDLLEPALEEIYFDPQVQLDGAAFWEVLTRPSLPERIEFWRREPTDELLYLPAADRDVSLLMAYTLPFLDDDPWRVRRELEQAVRSRPVRPAPDHFRFTLDLLRDMFGGSTWVERTGGSLPHARAITAGFPDARYVTLLRDPVETALSMRAGSFFRLYLAIEQGDAPRWRAPRFADPVALAAMVDRWTTNAERALATVPDRQVYHLTYERLTTEPVDTLVELVAFVLDRVPTEADRRWAVDQAHQVVAAPTRAGAVPAADLARIRAACPVASRWWGELRSTGR